MDIKDCIDVLLRRKKVFLAAVLLIFFGACLGTVVIRPVYETSCKLYFQPLSLENVSTSIGVIISNRGNTIDDHSHLEMVTSTKNVEAVIQRLQLRDRSGQYLLQSRLTKTVPLVSAFFPRPYLTVQHTSDTFVLDIKATSPDPEQAAMLANTLAAVYIEDNRRQRLEELGRAKKGLEERIDQGRRRHLELQEQLRQEKRQHDIVSLSDEYSSAIENYYSAIENKISALKELAATSAKVRKIREQLKNVGIDYVPGVAFSNYPAVSTLVEKINGLQNEMAAAKTELKDGHPELVRYRERIKELNRLLEVALKTFKTSDSDMQDLERQEEGNKATAAAADAAMAGYFANMKRLADNTLRLAPINLEISELQTSLSTLVENYYKIVVAEALTFDQIRYAQAAVPKRADDFARPKMAVFLVVGLFLGVCSGVGLAFLVDYLDESVRGPADARKYGLPVLGLAPLASGRPSGPGADAPWRDLRNRIRLARGGELPRLLLVVGYRDDDQARAVAWGLGRAMASGERRVLVVDADLANPAPGGASGQETAVGLADVLGRGADVRDCLIGGERPGLWRLPAGPVPDDPGALFDGERARRVWSGLREDFDAVVVLAPALDAGTDALILAADADAALLVARSGRARGEALVEARAALAGAGTAALGVALVGCPPDAVRDMV